jgi:Meiotically up-regulated gene 113/Homing endonuclease associated repeat
VMRERIISEIQRLAAESGRVPGIKAFEEQTGIPRREWMGKIWARWGDAIAEAGFEPNGLVQRLDSEFVLRSVADCCLSLGRLAAANDLKLYARQNIGFPSTATVENHFPRRVILVEALRTWVLQLENHKYAEIADMLPAPVRAPAELPTHQNYGHVYLLRAGEYYKIGQSSDLEKRVKAINVALPDKATLEHAISTDDPPGIEAYWHRRFADRRMNGEWFKLSRADILAFKKRKFQ